MLTVLKGASGHAQLAPLVLESTLEAVMNSITHQMVQALVF